MAFLPREVAAKDATESQSLSHSSTLRLSNTILGGDDDNDDDAVLQLPLLRQWRGGGGAQVLTVKILGKDNCEARVVTKLKEFWNTASETIY